MTNLTRPIIGLHFMRQKNLVIDTTLVSIHFSHLTMQAKSTASGTSVQPQAVFIQDRILTTKTITAFVDHSSDWNTTGTVIPLGKTTAAASLLTSYSMSTKIDQKLAVMVTNTTESPYSINKNTKMNFPTSP